MRKIRQKKKKTIKLNRRHIESACRMTSHSNFSIKKALQHLQQADPVLHVLINRYGPYKRLRVGDPYHALLSSIISQQLSRAAASTIRRRLFALLGNEKQAPTPAMLLKTSVNKFRNAGVSQQKASYLKDLAKRIESGELNLKNIDTFMDEEIIAQLTTVRGIGEWTAHMFLIFHLGRPDILPTGDLGVRKGMQRVYNLRKAPELKRMQQIARPWVPYRSVGSWYMWRVLEND